MNNSTVKRYFISLTITMVATAISVGMLAVMLNDIIHDYALHGVQEGLMSSLISVGALLALISTIMLQGRIRKVQWIMGGGLVMTLTLVVMGIPLPFIGFLAACLILGVGIGVTDANQSAIIPDLAGEKSARYFGILHGVFGFFNFLLPPILYLLLSKLPWRSVYLLMGSAAVVLIIQFALTTHRLQGKVPAVRMVNTSFRIKDLGAYARNPALVLLLATMFFGAAGQSGVIVWTLRYVSVYLQDPQTATLSLSLFWICSMISRITAPYLPITAPQVLAYGALISGVAWMIALIINTPAAFIVICCIAGLTSGPCIPMALHQGSVVCPGQAGVTTSVLMIVKTIAQALAPLIVASVMAILSMRIAMQVTTIFFILNGIAALAMGAAALAAKSKQQGSITQGFENASTDL